MKDGPFIDAYKNGRILILDEINLASKTVLQCIGEAIDNKTFILDVLVKLNNNKLINLEMQVINTSYWVERSLSYLCRTFDRLEKGERYDRVLPVP